MTSELMKLKPKELEAYQKAVALIKKVHNITDEQFDEGIRLLKEAKALMALVVSVSKDQMVINANTVKLELGNNAEKANDLYSQVFGDMEGGS